MRIAVVGATGTIGGPVADALEARDYEVFRASRSSERQIDIEDPDSIRSFYESTGVLDAVVCAAGRAAFGPLDELDDAQLQLCVDSKLMGQVNLVRLGRDHIAEGGSFTLTSGILSQTPWPGTFGPAMVNAGIEGFVRAAALDLEDDRRINVVCPPLVRETAEAMGMGTRGAPATSVAEAYVQAVESEATAQTIFVEGWAPNA